VKTVSRNVNLVVTDFIAAFAVMRAHGKENCRVLFCGMDSLL